MLFDVIFLMKEYQDENFNIKNVSRNLNRQKQIMLIMFFDKYITLFNSTR